MKYFISLMLVIGGLCVSAMAAGCYPVEIQKLQDGESVQIRKIYQLDPAADPSQIPREEFEQDGYAFSFADLLQAEQPKTETKLLVQPATASSKSKDMESVLKLFPQTKIVTTEDGFSGTLTLDTATIQTEVSGYGSSSKTVTATRTYPNLADADTAHIPKSISEGGRTLNLSNVQWQTDNTQNVDDNEIGNRYTAVATYSGTATSSYAKGYTVTAEYKGNVSKTSLSAVLYTAVFTREKIKQPFRWWYLALPLAGFMIGAAGTEYSHILRKRKERRLYEMLENIYRSHLPNSGNGFFGAGTGIQL